MLIIKYEKFQILFGLPKLNEDYKLFRKTLSKWKSSDFTPFSQMNDYGTQKPF